MPTPEIPLYGGNQHNIAQTLVRPVETPDVSSQAVAQAQENSAKLFADTANAFVKLKDAGVAQDEERQLRLIRSESEIALHNATQLAPGSEGSLFNTDGTRNDTVFNNICFESAKKIQDINSSYIDPVKHFESEEKRKNVALDIGTRGNMLIARHGIQASRQAYADNYNLAMQAGDFEAARQSNILAAESGSITRAAAMQELFKINKTEGLYTLQNMPPQERWEQLNSGAFDHILSPMEQEKLRKETQAQTSASRRDDFFHSFTLTPKSQLKKNSKNAEPEFTGMFSEQECQWIKEIQAGNSNNVEPAIQSAAIEEASSLPFMDANSDNFASMKANFFRKYEQFGLDKPFINDQWARYETLNKAKEIPTIDSKSILDRLKDRGELENNEAIKFFTNKLNDYPSYKEKLINDLRSKEGRKLAENQAIGMLIAKEKESHAELTRRKISEDFSIWKATEEGLKATPFTQEQKLISITKRITGNKDLNYTPSQEKADSLYSEDRKNAENAQNNKYQRWLEKRGKLNIVDTSPTKANSPLAPAIISYETTQKDLPEGILLPANMMKDINPEDATVDITFDNKKFRRFRVLGTTESDSPQMTYAVAKSGLYRLDRAYKVNMRVNNGNAEELIQEQENAPKPKTDDKGIHTSVIGNPTTDEETLSQHTPNGLKPYLRDFIQAGEQYDVDPALLLSIAKVETANGTSSAFRNKNNAMGVSPNGGGPRAFGSVKESIDYMTRILAKNYIGKGKTNIADIGAIYAPEGASNDPHNTNGTWSSGVSNHYNKIKKQQNEYTQLAQQ